VFPSIPSTLTDESVWAVPLVLVIVVIVFFVLSSSFAVELLREIFRTIGSVFQAPFRYIRKTAREVSLGENDPRLNGTDHYLSTKFLSIIRVVLVGICVLGSALTIVLAVEAFLPPLSMRTQARSERDQLAKAQSDLKQAQQKLDQEDSDWTNRRSSVIQEQRDARNRAIASGQSALASDEHAIEQDPAAANIMAGVKQYLSTRAGTPSSAEDAKGLISKIPSLGERQTTLLDNYCDDWEKLQESRLPLPENETALRARVQPDHLDLIDAVKSKSEEVQNGTSSLRSEEEEVSRSYSLARSLETLASGLGVLLMYVWLVGLAIELFSMALYILADVKRIRENSDRSPGV
jgi:hypothetical protein